MSNASMQAPTPRYEGLDFARAIAILGMVLVNFTAVTEEGASPECLLFLLGIIQGRAAAIFVVLAGVGVSLLSRRARHERSPVLLRQARSTLLRRAAFLLVLGIVLVPLWPPDILHFYALYLTASIFVLRAPVRLIWALAVLAVLAFVALFLLFNYDAGWTEEGQYAGFWTVSGTLRRMFFDGYYPFLPWVAFLLAGMWLGRQDLGDGRLLTRTLWISLCVALCVQLLSWYLTGLSEFVEIESDTAPLDLLGTDPYPPGPFFIVTSTGFAITVVILSLRFASAFPENPLTRVFTPTGQLALSIYVAHATLGLLLLDYLAGVYEESATLAATTALAFCCLSAVFAVLWRRCCARGPLEIIMRKLTGSS